MIDWKQRCDNMLEQITILKSLEAENTRLTAERDALQAALGPFSAFGQTDDGDIRDGLMRDRICDWFGPSDFDCARAGLADSGPDPVAAMREAALRECEAIARSYDRPDLYYGRGTARDIATDIAALRRKETDNAR